MKLRAVEIGISRYREIFIYYAVGSQICEKFVLNFCEFLFYNADIP